MCSCRATPVGQLAGQAPEKLICGAVVVPSDGLEPSTPLSTKTHPSMAFIQGSVVCLRQTMRASFQTAAFATSTIVQMRASTKAQEDDNEVAAFPGPRLRHFQKQGSVKEELKRSRSRVQVELKLRGTHGSKRLSFGSPHWKCRNGRTPFASSNLARSATIPRLQGFASTLRSVAAKSPG